MSSLKTNLQELVCVYRVIKINVLNISLLIN